MTDAVYLVDAKRTPVGKFGGSLSGLPATKLGAIVIKTLLEKNPEIAKHIDEVILGNVLSAGLGQNPARIAAIEAGIDKEVPSFSVNKVCGSGLKSVMLGVSAIQNNEASLIIAGGMENMSRVPYLLDNHRFGAKLGDQVIKDSMIYDGLFCSLTNESMGVTAENIAKKYKISREEQDKYALASHHKAITARGDKKFSEEIIPVNDFSIDEQPRDNTSLEALHKLIPAFLENGTVTAGNSSSLNDAAAGVVIASSGFVKKNNLKPLVKVIGYCSVGLEPSLMGLGGYYAAKKCLEKASVKKSDIDLWEINEAFASQSIAVLELLGIDKDKVNVNGGAIALGHPIGASGARILTTLIYELKRQAKQLGLVSLCIGGGQGVAMIVESI